MSAIKLWYIPFVVPITMLFGTPRFQIGHSTHEGAHHDTEFGECLGCRDIVDTAGRQAHWVFYFFAPSSGFGGQYHFNVRQGTCDLTHGWCISVPRGGGESLTALELTQEIANAVHAGDIASLVKYANMSSVKLFPDRSAIQVLNCDGETIAGHVPVRPSMLSAIEVAAATAALDPEA